MSGTAVRPQASTTSAPRDYRPDIQYLRALAVGTVVVFHVWPGALPGGYVGVDVFFVISGFLIIGHLLSEASTTGTVRLGRFWARRIRRLLPAAFTVILVSAIAAFLFLPREALRTTAEHAIASALYFENWLLAFSSVDYLDAENDPTVFQHYWSLSVEEQFYLLWPIILVVVLLTTRGILRRSLSARGIARVTAGTIGIIVAASFVASVLITPGSPEFSYFSTPLRAWEFGAGGLIALLLLRWDVSRIPAPIRIALWSAGVIAVLIAAFTFSGETIFPGVAALLPVAGTALALLMRLPAPARGAVGVVSVGLERIGTWSYSIYLWHWPVLIVVPVVLGVESVGLLLGLLLIVAVVIVSAATERWIEQPFRFAKRFSAPVRALPILLVGSALVVIPALSAIAALDARAAQNLVESDERIDQIGANAGEDGFRSPATGALYPALDARLDDTESQYRCYAPKDAPYEHCGWGADDADVRIALVGDSHAGSFVPALIPLVQDRGWRLDVMTGNGCALKATPDCAAGDAILDSLRSGDYDVVLVTSWRDFQDDVATVTRDWRMFMSEGLAIVPIVDVPHFPETTNECLSSASDAFAAARCWTSVADSEADRLDSNGQAARELGLPLIDLSDRFCRENRCPAVIGNVIVYRDSPYSHITATFSRTLASALGEQLVPIVVNAAAS